MPNELRRRGIELGCLQEVWGSIVAPPQRMGRRVLELIPVLYSQPAGDVSHKPGSRLSLLECQACSYPRNP